MIRHVLGVDVDVISEDEAIHNVAIDPGEHVAMLGAGLSAEAGVPLAEDICDNIRKELARSYPADDDQWAHDNLNWDDETRRYSTCVEKYGPSAESRVKYFRGLLKGISPSFAHQALTLLMSNGILHPTALTTNFDKLIEKSFVDQNARECQAIRMADEAEFWGQENDKCYLLKLHGDYDTHNILNTRDETRSIDSCFEDIARILLPGKGLLGLGSAGNEESVKDFLGSLLRLPDKKILSRGVRWGVYVGARRPDRLSDGDSADMLVKAVKDGRLNRRFLEMLGDYHTKQRSCQLFPFWGSGGFFLRLIKRVGDPALMYNAQLLLDHDMRVASLLETRGIPPEAIDKHLAQLRRAQAKLSERQHTATAPPRRILDFKLKTSGATVEIVYGDIVSQDLLNSADGDGRRAVISADDTLISAGGGVALSLLSKAGKIFLLNELGKLTPIPQGSAVVTSAGSLPVHYIIHAAAMEIDGSGDYSVTAESIEFAVADVLLKAESLDVASLFIPLIGAGVGGVSPEECLNAILKAADSSPHLPPDHHVTVVIFDEVILGRNVVQRAQRRWQGKAKPRASRRAAKKAQPVGPARSSARARPI